LASDINYKIAIINLNSVHSDDHLSHRMADCPERSIILLEDVDAMFIDRTSVQKRKRGVTFSGFLNALDGVRSKDGTILIMTTNHREKLDPALIRPGRCDL
jgi:chaperone BCS1